MGTSKGSARLRAGGEIARFEASRGPEEGRNGGEMSATRLVDRSTPRFSRSRARRHTCTSAGPRFRAAAGPARRRASRSCATTSPAGSAAAPRYRQKLAPVPLGLNAPVWIDDEEFDLDRHVHHGPTPTSLGEVDRRRDVPPARSRPAAVGALDRRPPRRRPDRRRRQGPPLHGRRHRRRRAGHAAARPDSRAAAGRPRSVAAGSVARSRAALLADGLVDRARTTLDLAAPSARGRALARDRPVARRRTGGAAAPRALADSLRPADPAHRLQRADLARVAIWPGRVARWTT